MVDNLLLKQLTLDVKIASTWLSSTSLVAIGTHLPLVASSRCCVAEQSVPASSSPSPSFSTRMTHIASVQPNKTLSNRIRYLIG